ncbi:hypothetical protein TNCV_3334481 [Trichonephila clavipes]|nr:hypothetical protein TNCV_3334481 [Trichonephila clavipes]
MFKQDNARPYVVEIARTFLDTENVQLSSWPTCSLDLLLIENVWYMVSERLALHHTPVTTVDELWYRVEAAWFHREDFLSYKLFNCFGAKDNWERIFSWQNYVPFLSKLAFRNQEKKLLKATERVAQENINAALSEIISLNVEYPLMVQHRGYSSLNGCLFDVGNLQKMTSSVIAAFFTVIWKKYCMDSVLKDLRVGVVTKGKKAAGVPSKKLSKDF